MTLPIDEKHLERFLQTLRVVAKEAMVLEEVRARLLLIGTITPEWVTSLATQTQLADMVESFAAKFGRMQDTIGDKLLPLFLRMVGEKMGAAIDNLNRGERLDLIPDTIRWMEIRTLRNQLVNEYMEDPAQFADALNQARGMAEDLLVAYRNFRRYSAEELQIDRGMLPDDAE